MPASAQMPARSSVHSACTPSRPHALSPTRPLARPLARPLTPTCLSYRTCLFVLSRPPACPLVPTFAPSRARSLMLTPDFSRRSPSRCPSRQPSRSLAIDAACTTYRLNGNARLSSACAGHGGVSLLASVEPAEQARQLFRVRQWSREQPFHDPREGDTICEKLDLIMRVGY